MCEKREVELGCKVKTEGSLAGIIKRKFRKFRHSIEPPKLLVVPFTIKEMFDHCLGS